MTPPPEITEDDLHAYLDGELDTGRTHEVEAWLAAHPEDRARVETWREQNAGLHALYDGVLDEEQPPRLVAAITRTARPAQQRHWMRAAAALVLFLAGGVAGWMLRGGPGSGGDDAAGFLRQAVGAHVVFTAEKRHAVEVKADKEERHLIAWLSKRLGHPIKPPPLAGTGFVLVGGRLVSDLGGPAAQFMYQDKDKRRLTLYVRRESGTPDTAFRFASERGVSAFYWIDSPLSYAIIAKMERGELLRLARIIYGDLGS